eukprot:4814005-Prorocentrum_lima.AAC.1
MLLTGPIETYYVGVPFLLSYRTSALSRTVSTAHKPLLCHLSLEFAWSSCWSRSRGVLLSLIHI